MIASSHLLSQQEPPKTSNTSVSMSNYDHKHKKSKRRQDDFDQQDFFFVGLTNKTRAIKTNRTPFASALFSSRSSKIWFVLSQSVKRPISRFRQYHHFAETAPRSSFGTLLHKPMLLHAYKISLDQRMVLKGLRENEVECSNFKKNNDSLHSGR